MADRIEEPADAIAQLVMIVRPFAAVEIVIHRRDPSLEQQRCPAHICPAAARRQQIVGHT
jgi:hypothetical protein